VMKDGWVQQVGEPLELYNRPANRFVAGFIGSPAMNLVDVALAEKDGAVWAEGSGFAIRVAQAGVVHPCRRLRSHGPQSQHCSNAADHHTHRNPRKSLTVVATQRAILRCRTADERASPIPTRAWASGGWAICRPFANLCRPSAATGTSGWYGTNNQEQS